MSDETAKRFPPVAIGFFFLLGSLFWGAVVGLLCAILIGSLFSVWIIETMPPKLVDVLVLGFGVAGGAGGGVLGQIGYLLFGWHKAPALSRALIWAALGAVVGGTSGALLMVLL